MSNIRVHKKINLSPIKMGKENLINTFYGLIEKYNKQIEYKPLELSKMELWELAGYKGEYNSKYIIELINDLTKADTYNVSSINPKISTISGSMFIVTTFSDARIKINVPEDFRPYLFYKKDIDLMTKAKHKKKMSIADLDHYDRVTKEKSKFLVLLKKADLLGISGKYNKRLYALLSQWNKTRKYTAKWEDFKEILEIPKSYQSANIDQRIMKVAKKELLKVGLKITKIEKFKKGRSIDRIEILFKIENTKISKQIQGVNTSDEKVKGHTEEITSSINSDFLEKREELRKIVKKEFKVNNPNFGIIIGKISNCNTIDELQNLKDEINENIYAPVIE